MGSARHRSWSYTRGNLALQCPRALYFQYYPWGDKKQNFARFLKRAATPASLAGTIVHRNINIGLRQLIRKKSYPSDLHITGAAQYAEALSESRMLAHEARSSRRPPDEGTVLFHHLYGQEDLLAEQKGLEVVKESLKNFETSRVLEFLKGTNFDRWERILTDTDDVPSFYATAEIGFQSAIGLRVFTAYDLALAKGDDFIILDWKVGARTYYRELDAKRQLAVYAIWARANGWPLDKVQVAVIWLEDSQSFQIQRVDEEIVSAAIEQIEADNEFEEGATTRSVDRNGVVLSYKADLKQFPTRPEARRCGWCPYRSICEEGKAAAKQLAKAS